MQTILFLFLLVLILSVWLLPSATPVLGIALIVISLSIAIFSIVRKHRISYLQGKLTRAAFVRNTALDVFGILLAMALAVLLSRYVVGLVIRPLNNDTIRLMAGILIGLLLGIGVGIFVSRVWGRLIKTSPEG